MWSSVWTSDPSAGLALLGNIFSNRKHWEIVRFRSPLCPVWRQPSRRPARRSAVVAPGHGALTARVRRSSSEQIPWELFTQQAPAVPCQARMSHIQLFRDVDVWLAPSSKAWWGSRWGEGEDVCGQLAPEQSHRCPGWLWRLAGAFWQRRSLEVLPSYSVPACFWILSYIAASERHRETVMSQLFGWSEHSISGSGFHFALAQNPPPQVTVPASEVTRRNCLCSSSWISEPNWL